MVFDFHFSPIAIALFSLALILLIAIIFGYCRRLLAVAASAAACKEASDTDLSTLPKAAVIVYAFDEPEALRRTLQCLVEQDYAPGFKIIVVNDGASADVNMVVNAMKAQHPNIYETYTPSVGRNVARRKLALTIGIKAADPDSAVFIVDDHTIIPSNKWLASMAQHFADPDTGLVLGYGHTESNLPVANFDALADSATWIAAATSGHPYRGCAYNIAYRAALFFNNNGFARSIDLKNGDDDIFVHSIAAQTGTAVELSAAAQVMHTSHFPSRDMKDSRIIHAFTGRRLPLWPRHRQAIGEWLMWAEIAAAIAAACICGTSNLAGWAISVLLAIAMLVAVAASWGKCAKALDVKTHPLLLPLLAMTRPLRNIAVNLRSRSKSLPHFAWQ